MVLLTFNLNDFEKCKSILQLNPFCSGLCIFLNFGMLFQFRFLASFLGGLSFGFWSKQRFFWLLNNLTDVFSA